jgi:tetratricopeptide (TPR) repeat protein
MKIRSKLVLIFLIVLMSQVHSFCQVPDEIIRQAQKAYGEGKYVEAYDLLAPLAKENRANEVAYFYLGMIASQGEHYGAAEKCFRKAISMNPKFAPPYCDLSALLMMKNMYREAEDAAAMAAKLDPKYAFGFVNLGIAQLALKKKKEARENIGQAAKLDPGVVTNCGINMLLNENDPESALLCFEISLDADPDQPVALYDSGQACRTLGDNRKALEMFKKAYEMTPVEKESFKLVYTGYFRQLLDMGDYETIFNTGLSRVVPDYPEGQLFRALAYYKLDKKSEFERTARKYFSLSGQPMPGSLETWAKELVKAGKKQ